MNEEVAKSLLTYGPLGVICLGLTWAVIKLYRDLQGERAIYRKEMGEFQERYITKADTWMSQYHELQKRMADIIEAATHRRAP